MNEKEKRRNPQLKKFWRWFDEAVGPDGFKDRAEEIPEQYTIYPEDLEDYLSSEDDDFVVIDTRELEQYERAHVKGAINIPLDDMLDDIGCVEPYTDKTIALVCNSGTTTALFAAIYLVENGFEEVFNLDQGIQGWISAGGAIEPEDS